MKHYRVECTLLYHIPFSHLQLNCIKLGYTFSDNYLLSSLPKTVAMHLTCIPPHLSLFQPSQSGAVDAGIAQRQGHSQE